VASFVSRVAEFIKKKYEGLLFFDIRLKKK
jgi:hypothetical protein